MIQRALYLGEPTCVHLLVIIASRHKLHNYFWSYSKPPFPALFQQIMIHGGL